MKLRCPRCEKKLDVPDKFAGKAIRCPACNRAFTVPKAKVAVSGPGMDANLDLEGLAALESRSTQLGEEEMAAHQADAQAKAVAGNGRPGVRTCPNCGKETKVKDPYSEILCSHCWQPIPGLIQGDAYDTGGVKLVGYKGNLDKGSVGFYTGLTTSMAYPTQALASLLVAILIAIGIILFPVALMTGVAKATMQSGVGSLEGVQEADLSGVQIFLRGVFLVEVLFFSAVGVHAFLDVIRTTAIGQEKPPTLVWNPGSWGSSVVGYVALVI
jgi:DNA-directed RNA polymerase subunit RPC12/RpoP